jgi:hypothetical protein
VYQLFYRECPKENFVENQCIEECLKLSATLVAKNVAILQHDINPHLIVLAMVNKLRFDISLLSDEARLNLKKTMWYIRTSGALFTTVISKDLLEEWMKLERFRPACQESASLKPEVSLIDPKERLISVSMPIESVTGEYYVGIRVLACFEGYPETTIATVEREDIEKCLQDGRDEASTEAVLPDSGTWSISVQGLLLRKGVKEAPRLAKCIIDLETKRPIADRGQSLETTDEVARQNAGDILGTIRKLRGPSCAQMGVESRFSLLHTAVVRGRSTLSKLKDLVESNGCDDESAPGIAVLTDALAEAHLPMAELEAAMKLRNKKERVKGFKVCV